MVKGRSPAVRLQSVLFLKTTGQTDGTVGVSLQIGSRSSGGKAWKVRRSAADILVATRGVSASGLASGVENGEIYEREGRAGRARTERRADCALLAVPRSSRGQLRLWPLYSRKALKRPYIAKYDRRLVRT